MPEDTENETKLVELYSAEAQKQDEQKFNESLENGELDLSTFRRVMLRDIITNSDIIETGSIGLTRLEDVSRALENPKMMWRVLLDASQTLMHVSPHYYRLNSLYANMAVFNWWIGISSDDRSNVNVDAVKKRYNRLSMKLDSMNLKHEFSKIMRFLPYQDVYCGLVIENSTDFFFQKIDYRICKLFQIQDGLYNFKIDLGQIKATQLKAYPSYVQDAYLDYLDGKHAHWYAPPADKQICIKMNHQWTYPFPILIGLIKDILDLEVYKKLKLQSARTDNYKAILVEVPIDESKVDTPLISPNVLSVFAELNRESMSKDIGMIHTLGSKGEAISFKDSNNTRNNVSDAVDELYSASGISSELFNSKGNATAMTFSVETDAGFVYDVYRQLERWVNRFIKLRKFNMPKAKFLFYIIDSTVFNKDAVSKRYKESAAMGVSIDRWLASLDMTPSLMNGYEIMSKDIFDFHNKLIPLTSAYNASAATQASEGGRPTAKDSGEQISDEGERTQDQDKNDG